MQLIKFKDTSTAEETETPKMKDSLTEESQWNKNVNHKRQKKRMKIIKEVVINICYLVSYNQIP